jgi:predicted transglutaminase-like cysteine proteinase
MLLLAPANMAAADDFGSVTSVKTSAILGGAPSRLAMIAAQQSGGSSPTVEAPALKITEATSRPLARTVTLASTDASASVRSPYLQRAVLTQPTFSPERAVSRSPDLFGSKAIRIGSTRLDSKWRSVSRGSAGSAQTLSRIAYTDRAEQLRQVNSTVNHALTFREDSRTYGQADHWASAQESLRRGAGDCEDYAIAKMQILRAAGVPARDLHLVIVRDLVRRQDHAVLAVRTGDGFAILDSNTDKVLRADQVSDYRPIMTFSTEGTWIHGYAEPKPQPQIQLASNGPSIGSSN